MPILAVYSQATRPLVEANMNVERWSDVYLWPTYLIMYFKSQVTLVYSVLPRNNFFVCIVETPQHPRYTAESIDGIAEMPQSHSREVLHSSSNA